jgi:hypothetical protein
VPPRAHRHSTTAGERLKDWLPVLKDIEPLWEGFKLCDFITEDIAVLLCANDDMVYDLTIALLPGNRAMNRCRPSAGYMEVAALAGDFNAER